MKKVEIIDKVLREARNCDDGQSSWTGPGHTYLDYVQADVVHRLEHLSPEVNVRTCEDFSNLRVTCCPVCHKEYPDEQNLVELASGGTAWVCCAMERALLVQEIGQLDLANA